MKNECSFVRDVLPLYFENMVSEDTAEFVKEHLENCTACCAEFENMKKPNNLDRISVDMQDDGVEQLKAIKKKLGKRNKMIVSITAIVTAVIVLLGAYFIGSGFTARNDVALLDYSVSEDGTEITLYTAVMSSMGYIRGYSDNGGGVKPHYLTFYSTFGGLNSSFGAKQEFVLRLDKDDTEIWFNRADGGYELVLQKNCNTDEWVMISNYIVDTNKSEESGFEHSSITLKNETVYLEIDPTNSDIQLTEDSVLTNTTQISVSAEKITGDTKISLFLYNADSMDTPILYATLTAKDKSVNFTGLTSRFAYKIGATIEGTTEGITLEITD